MVRAATGFSRHSSTPVLMNAIRELSFKMYGETPTEH
jgi:hypothetical protein